MIEIRQLLNKEKDEALLFVKKVYIESKDESYSENSIETFCNFIDNKEITKSFKVYGAFGDNILKGVIATDKRKRHINLFFVDKSSIKTEEEKEQDGLKFTPMKLILKDEVKGQ